MTDRRPSGFRMYRQPPPTGHYAPEAEAYHHRQNTYFQIKAVMVIGVVVAILFLVLSDTDFDNPFTGPYRELPLPTAQEKHDKRDGAMDWRELRAHMAEGPHGVRP